MHSIRLRHPWQSRVSDDVIVWSRKFNWPADLVEGERLWLVVEPMEMIVAMVLNGQPVAVDGAGRLDISRLIAPHNRLEISTPLSDEEPAAECPVDVRLEVLGG